MDPTIKRPLGDSGVEVTQLGLGGAAYGSIYREVLKVAGEFGCDLIVLASHRPEITDYILGPNAERVVRHAEQSVMVVRG